MSDVHFSTVLAVVSIFIMLRRLFAFFFILVTHFGALLGPVLFLFCLFVSVPAGLRARSSSCSCL